MSAYRDAKGNILVSLLTTDAEKAAGDFVFGKPQISSAQLRRFYGEFKGLEMKLRFKSGQTSGFDETAFGSILPLIKMVKSKVAYAENPKSAKIPASFGSWLKGHVDRIQTAADFEAFLLHFEAVVGFCYGLGLKNS